MISLMRNRLLALIVTTYLIGFISSPAWASVIPSLSSSGNTAAAPGVQSDIEKVQLALENKLVQEKLRAHGLSADEVRAKLSEMTPSQVHLLSQASDDLLAGGDGLGTVIGVLIVVLLIIVIMKLLGKNITINLTLEDTAHPDRALIG